MAKTDLTAQRLRELLHYDPETGVFTRLQTLPGQGQRKAGTIAGGNHGTGYVVMTVDGVTALAHQFAWLYMTGEWPTNKVDHENTQKSDNRFKNLRLLSHQHNTQNQRRPHSNNKVGLLGVHARKGRFVASIWVDGGTRHIGMFGTAEEAHAAYVEAKRRLHEGCTI